MISSEYTSSEIDGDISRLNIFYHFLNTFLQVHSIFLRQENFMKSNKKNSSCSLLKIYKVCICGFSYIKQTFKLHSMFPKWIFLVFHPRYKYTFWIIDEFTLKQIFFYSHFFFSFFLHPLSQLCVIFFLLLYIMRWDWEWKEGSK